MSKPQSAYNISRIRACDIKTPHRRLFPDTVRRNHGTTRGAGAGPHLYDTVPDSTYSPALDEHLQHLQLTTPPMITHTELAHGNDTSGQDNTTQQIYPHVTYRSAHTHLVSPAPACDIVNLRVIRVRDFADRRISQQHSSEYSGSPIAVLSGTVGRTDHTKSKSRESSRFLWFGRCTRELVSHSVRRGRVRDGSCSVGANLAGAGQC